MKTSEALFKQYGKKYIPATEVLSEFFGMDSVDTGAITKLIAKDKLHGLRLFRMGGGKGSKAPYLADIDQLADVLDAKARAGG